MHKTFLLLTVILFTSCNNKAGYQKAEDAEDAGREFIRASLDGNYDKAYYYMYKDSTNTNKMILDKWRKDYSMLKQQDKVNYKEANIIAVNIDAVNDSTVNYVYTNTFEIKDTTIIKIIRVNDDWLIDLKDIH